MQVLSVSAGMLKETGVHLIHEVMFGWEYPETQPWDYDETMSNRQLTSVMVTSDRNLVFWRIRHWLSHNILLFTVVFTTILKIFMRMTAVAINKGISHVALDILWYCLRGFRLHYGLSQVVTLSAGSATYQIYLGLMWLCNVNPQISNLPFVHSIASAREPEIYTLLWTRWLWCYILYACSYCNHQYRESLTTILLIVLPYFWSSEGIGP